MSTTIPSYVCFENGHYDDDVDSLISFASSSFSSARTPYDLDADLDADLIDEDVEEVLEPTTTTAAANTNTIDNRWKQTRMEPRGSLEGPHRPKRAPSHSSSKNGTLSPVTPQSRNIKTGPLPSRVTPTRHTTRLTRMAERAKAVARTPVARRKSFQRHSLPVVTNSACGQRVIPTRQKSNRSRRSHHVDSFSSSSLSPCPMIPRRRNSIQCVLPNNKSFSRKRDGLLCPSRSTGRGLQDMIVQRGTAHGTTAAASTTSQKRSNCFQVSCRAAAAASAAGPPRLPQRYPSEANTANAIAATGN